MNVSEAIIKVLSAFDVRWVFGIPGDAINELVEAIRKQNTIRFIHMMHEESGAFAASAQAKLTGTLAVCTGTSGPGAIHLLNGLYDAKMDHAPVLAITGQVPTSLIGTDYHQEVDLISLFADVSVFNQIVINPEQIPEIVMLACQTAMAKKGVAHINIPSDISTKKVKTFNGIDSGAGIQTRVTPYENDLKAAAALIEKSERPCILAGIGAREAVEQLVEFSTRVQAPIIKTLRGKDMLPDMHPLTLGGIGLLGTKPAFKAIKTCDLLIAIGTDFPYHDFYPDKNTDTIQIDREITHIGRRHSVDVALAGDVKPTLESFMSLIIKKENNTFLKECQKDMQEWFSAQDEVELSDETPIHPQSLARMVGDEASENAIICSDTGAVTVWSARNFRIKGENQRFILSGGLATMAVALPSVIGAQLLFPDKQVIALCGDGGFAMLMCDFATAVKYKLPIKVFIFNNSKLGLIQMEQEAGSGNPEYETALHNPDYAAYAEICGAEGYTITDPADMRSTIIKALRSSKPCVVNVFVKPDELTLPPEISSKETFNYLKARIKEYFS